MTTRKIKTEAELRHYLTKRYWDVLIITEPIILTEPVFIERAVEIRCMGVGVIGDEYIGSESNHSLFVVKRGGVIFNKCRFYASAFIHSGLQSAIKFDTYTGSCSVTDCDFFWFSWSPIWHFNCKYLTVQGCYIQGNNGTSYNYGTWLGGDGDNFGQTLYFLNNQVSGVRHAIGSSYHPNSYYAIGNTISTLKHSFDRHNWNSGGRKGGMHTHIIGNKFLDPDRLAFSIEPPYEGGSFSFIGNTLNHSKERWIGEVSDQQVWEGKSPDWYTAHSNKFKI